MSSGGGSRGLVGRKSGNKRSGIKFVKFDFRYFDRRSSNGKIEGKSLTDVIFGIIGFSILEPRIKSRGSPALCVDENGTWAKGFFDRVIIAVFVDVVERTLEFLATSRGRTVGGDEARNNARRASLKSPG